MKTGLGVSVSFLIVIFLCFGCGRGRNQNEGDDEGVQPSDESTLPPLNKDEDNRPIILAFGDSLTAGSGVEPSENYPSKLQAKVDAAGFRYRVANGGVSGETSAQGLDRLDAACALRPSVVVVELGANDGLRGLPVETTFRNLAAIIRRFQSVGAKVVLAGMRMPPNYGPTYTAAFENIYTELAEKYQISLIPFFLEGVGGHPELNQEDGIHPTGRGYDVVVEGVWKAVKPLL